MKLIRTLLGLSLMLMAINVFGQKVTTDSAPNVDWSKFKTYSWGEGTPAQDPLTAQRIVAAIDTQLSSKGYSKVDSDGDLLVIYHVASDQQKSLNWNSFGGWGRFGGMGSAQVDTVIVGQLKVDLADSKGKQFLWRGTANDSVTSDPKKNASKITKALVKMFQKWPPE